LPLFPWMDRIRGARRRDVRIGNGTGSLGVEMKPPKN